MAGRVLFFSPSALVRRKLEFFPPAEMEKKRFAQVSNSDEAEDKETILGAARKDQERPKKPRGGGLEEADAGQEDKGKAGVAREDEEGAAIGENAKTARDVVIAGEKESTLPVGAPRDGSATATSSSDLPPKAETPAGPSEVEAPRSSHSDASLLLANSQALTGDTHRDKWLERLVQGLRFACDSKDDGSMEERDKGSRTASRAAVGAETVNGVQGKDRNTGKKLSWSDAAIPAITALEKTVHDALGSDFRKYNQKMRQLDFNLRNNELLAKRFLNKELEPSVILNMTSQEMKEGCTTAEKTKQEPEQSQYIQMTDTRCSRCMEKRVGVVDIIHAGSVDRYQLECVACGHTWTASADAISSLTIEAPSVVGNVGAAPWATAKFEDVLKTLRRGC